MSKFREEYCIKWYGKVLASRVRGLRFKSQAREDQFSFFFFFSVRTSLITFIVFLMVGGAWVWLYQSYKIKVLLAVCCCYPTTHVTILDTTFWMIFLCLVSPSLGKKKVALKD